MAHGTRAGGFPDLTWTGFTEDASIVVSITSTIAPQPGPVETAMNDQLIRFIAWAANHRIGQVILLLIVMSAVLILAMLESAGLSGWE